MDEKFLLSQMSDMMEQHTQRIELKIENEVTKRIEGLFDGYKLTHDKQYELERQIETLKGQLNDLQTRLAVLEMKTA